MNSTEEIINDIRKGKMVIIIDDEDRENEGDLLMAAECVKASDINFMIKYARGLVCMPITEERCNYLGLKLMTENPRCANKTNFTLSIEAREGVTTGISASDRARTILTAVSKNTKPADIVHPGHIFPLKARNGGVLNRAGHTEAGVDLANLAGFEPAAVICEIIKDDGEMARKPELQDFAKEHQLKIGTVADLIHYRLKFENSLTLYDKSKVLTKYGSFELLRFQDNFSGNIHFALKKGEINPESPTLVRVQTNNTVRDLIQSVIPDTEAGWTFSKALKTIAMNEKGIIVLIHKNETIDELLHSSSMIMGKENIFEANEKDSTITVGIGSQILKESGIGKIILMAKPAHYSAISGFGLEITKFVAPKDCDTTIE